MTQTSIDSSMNQAARLGPNHGYAIEGDLALLHAEVAVPQSPGAENARWALQLWACDAPHSGGPLRGVKVAEAALSSGAPNSAEPVRLDTQSLAQVPGGLRDYSMVLVLASGAPGSFDQVHDFANYPDRQRFITPHLEGSVGYRVEDAEVVLGAERIRSPRTAGNLSGSLRLELWALKGAYSGGAIDGVALATLELGRLGGQNTFEGIEARVPFSPPPVGEWQVVLTLREWVDGVGFVTRDHGSFAVPYAVRAAAQPAAAVPAPVSPVAAAPVAVKPVAAAPVATPPVAAPPVAVKPVATSPVAAKPVAAAPAAATPVAATPVAATPVAATPVVAAPVAEAPVVKVSIMTASVEELAQVPGVNRKLAAEIVKFRPYKSMDDLVKVRGIGPKMILILRKVLTV